MSCEGCKSTAEKKGGASEAAFEFTVEKFSKVIRWLCVLLLVSLLGHIAWAVAWTQYDYSGEETVVEAADGIANYVRGDAGDIINGADRSP